MFNSDFWAPKTSIGLPNGFLESSRIVSRNLKFLLKTGDFLVIFHTFCTSPAWWNGTFRPFGNMWEKWYSLFFLYFQLWKWFLSPQNVHRTPKWISRELSNSFTKSEIFVKNWWFLGNIPYILYLTEKYHFTRPVRYKTYGILPRNHQFLTKISDFVKLFESSLEIHFGVLWTFWGLRNCY